MAFTIRALLFACCVLCLHTMASAKLDFCGVHVPSGEYIMRNTTKGFVQAHGRCTTEDDTDIRDQYESVLDWREANEVPTPVKCKEQLRNFLCMQCMPLDGSVVIKKPQTFKACEKRCYARNSKCRNFKLRHYVVGQDFQICC
mmetsp:Transcript_39100/g.47336  ORF Transcript_39100/g.47336 Transcript_39100/m.47336 type:complete len:143 (+) Transcript_39100:344-772(+)